MGKRPIIASGLTIAALALLLSFKTPETSTLAANNGSGSNTGNAANATAGTNANINTNTGSGTGTNAGANPTTVTGSGGGSGKSGSYTGQSVQTPFGTVQVRVTIQNGKITDVQALQLPTGRGHTQEISAYAGPQLRNEALQAQSAQIDTISGATYTSEGYIQSLQSALSQAA
jgi:uncharacterized protein with FMN-binding domain